MLIGFCVLISLDITPNAADFLYVYASPENHEAIRDEKEGTPFIQTLVEVMKKTPSHYHLEEVLFFVKNKMSKEYYDVVGDMHVKQMPSVVSQMRGRIFFAEDCCS